ncbi:hypothetical protein C4D60_Mb07t00420 [Musa balbisiana]|uniref:4-coumarate--CoA ligase n=1 Tax=Musa balbisiana TaxID=52838 RepID=A0A4V4H6B5_MUSBA|nr:hypothetical protein C4D60_Mb07t00420 [Musa balbisiana]
MEVYTIQVEEGKPTVGNKPSCGPVYRCIYAKDGLLESPVGIDSPWDFFSESVKRYPKNQMLGRREVIDGKAGNYVWQTYEEAYEVALKIGSAIRQTGVNLGDCCGIYGSNCPEWLIAMELSFVILTCLKLILTPAIVSFGMVTGEQKKEAENVGVSCFSWKEFVFMATVSCKLPPKKKNDICTIMYTSGTTGEPKGVKLTNKAIIAEVINNEYLLLETDKVFTEEDSYLSFLPLAHVFDQIMENYCIYKGASIGFWQGDVRYLMEDIQELKPTIFCGVPRVYDRIYTERHQSEDLIWRTVSKEVVPNLRRGFKQDDASPFFDRLIFNKVGIYFDLPIGQVIGGRVRIMISGAAPLPRHVEEFLRVLQKAVLGASLP